MKALEEAKRRRSYEADKVIDPKNVEDFKAKVNRHVLGIPASRLLGVMLDAYTRGKTAMYFSRDDLMGRLSIDNDYQFTATLELAKQFALDFFDLLVGNAQGYGWKICATQDEIDAELIKSRSRSLSHMASFARRYAKFGRNQQQIETERDPDLREVAVHLESQYQSVVSVKHHADLQISRCRTLLGPRLARGVLATLTPLKQIGSEQLALFDSSVQVIALADQLKKNTCLLPKVSQNIDIEEEMYENPKNE